MLLLCLGWGHIRLVFRNEAFDCPFGRHGNVIVLEQEATEQQEAQDDGSHVVDEVGGREGKGGLVHVELHEGERGPV